MPRIHRLTRSVIVPAQPRDVFAFFADAANLDAITPPWLHFRILTPLPIEMRRGAILDYWIRLRGVPMRWRTRIDAWDPPISFVDTQTRGPYTLWRHTHTFEDSPEGTICRDCVEYSHLGGPLMQAWFVGPEVERIFDYRAARLRELLGVTSRTHGAPSGASSARG